MKKYGKMSKIVIFWQNVKMVLFDVFEEFVYGINVENVIFCRIFMVEMWISWSWRIKRTIFTNNMMKVGSIVTSDLLIKLCGYRLHSVSPSLDQLDDESATNQIGRSWFWGALPGNLLYRGELQVSPCRRHMQEAHVHAGTEEVLCPLDQDQWRLYLIEWDFQKIHASIIMTYHITLIILNLTLYPLIQLEKLSFLLAMAMRFVIIK